MLSGLCTRTALVAVMAGGALASTAPMALASHVTFNGASVEAREIAPASDGAPRVHVAWEIHCSSAQYYGGVVMLYSYERGRVVSSVTTNPILPATGEAVTGDTAGPGLYKPVLFGASCGAVADDGNHAAHGPQQIDGPDFEICAGAPAGARSGGSWPVIPVGSGCASQCEVRASAAIGWPVIPVAAGCEPDCEPRASGSRSWPVVPARETCAPERMTKDGKAPVPVHCPGSASASRAWPVLPTAGRCAGKVKLTTAKRVPCAAAAIGWPVVRCSAVRRSRIALGSARFRLAAGRTGIVPVKLGRNGRRTVRKLKRARVRAVITLRKGERRARTARKFTLRAR